jgi:hypothetical protein
MRRCRRCPVYPASAAQHSPWRPGASDANRFFHAGIAGCDGWRLGRPAFTVGPPRTSVCRFEADGRRGYTLQSPAAQAFPDVTQSVQEQSISTLVRFTPMAGGGTMWPSNQSMSQQPHPIQGNNNMNTHLTIRPVIAAAALAAVIGMTSALSVARAGEAGTQSTTIGAAGPHQPSPYVDYDNTWLTGTTGWNAERAMGWRR